MQIEDSDGEDAADDGMDREAIANQLFEGDDVSNGVVNYISYAQPSLIHSSIFFLLFPPSDLI